MADVRPEDLDTTIHARDGAMAVAVTHRPSGAVGRSLSATGPSGRELSSERLKEQARRHLVDKLKGGL